MFIEVKEKELVMLPLKGSHSNDMRRDAAESEAGILAAEKKVQDRY